MLTEWDVEVKRTYVAQEFAGLQLGNVKLRRERSEQKMTLGRCTENLKDQLVVSVGRSSPRCENAGTSCRIPKGERNSARDCLKRHCARGHP